MLTAMVRLTTRVRLSLLISVLRFLTIRLEFVKVSQVLICVDCALLIGFVDDAFQVVEFSVSSVLNNLTQCKGLFYVKNNYCIIDVTRGCLSFLYKMCLA